MDRGPDFIPHAKGQAARSVLLPPRTSSSWMSSTADVADVDAWAQQRGLRPPLQHLEASRCAVSRHLSITSLKDEEETTLHLQCNFSHLCFSVSMNQLQIRKVAGLNYQEMAHVIKSIKWGGGGEQKQILEDTLGSAQMRECSTRSFSEILLRVCPQQEPFDPTSLRFALLCRFLANPCVLFPAPCPVSDKNKRKSLLSRW